MASAPPPEVLEPEPVDWESLQFKPLQVEVKLQVSEEISVPSHASLLAVSSKYGYVVFGTDKGFAFARLSDVRSAIKNATKGTVVRLPNLVQVQIPADPVHQIRLDANELAVVACTAGGVLYLYDVKELAAGNAGVPAKTIPLGGPVVDVRPNPEFLPDAAAVLREDGHVYMVNVDGSSKRVPLEGVTTICWSPKGKQLSCGLKDGTVVQVTPEGIQKNRIPPPPDLPFPPRVHFLFWLENSLFVVVYAPVDEEDGQANVLCVISQAGTPKRTTYTKLEDPVFPESERKSRYYIEYVKALGKNIKYVLSISNANSVDFGFAGSDAEGRWANWSLAEGQGVSMPLDDKEENTWVVGMGVDFSSEDTLPAETPDEPPLPPVPILLAYNNVGHILAFHCLDMGAAKRGEKFEAMCQAQEIPGGTSNPAGFSTPAQPVFGAPSKPATSAPAQGSLFGSLSKPLGTTAPATTAASSFGFATATPSFGTATPIAQASGFGKPSATPSPFGASGASTSSTQASPFGQASVTTSHASGFGKPSAAPSPFGASTSNTQSLFGQASAGTSQASAFGKPSAAPSLFGASAPSTQSPFGQASTAPSQGSGFGGAFGTSQAATSNQESQKSLFGTPSKPAAQTLVQPPAVTPAAVKPALTQPPSVSPGAPGFKLPPKTPIPTVQSVSKPPSAQKITRTALPFSAGTAREETSQAMLPMKTAEPKEDDTPEIIQSKFEELYTAFCAEMDNFGLRLQSSAEAVKAAGKETPSDALDDPDRWTLADVQLLDDRTRFLSKRVQEYKAELEIWNKESVELRNNIPRDQLQAEDCRRRLDILQDPSTADYVRDAPLGPEDEELRNSILTRSRAAWKSLQQIADQLERSQYEGKTEKNSMLKTPDWASICRATHHITRTTINKTHDLDELTQTLTSLMDGLSISPERRKPRPRTPRKGKGFGLRDFDDDEEEEEVLHHTRATSAAIRANHLRRLLKQRTQTTKEKYRINSGAMENQEERRLKDPETYNKARAAMLKPPLIETSGKEESLAPPKTAREVLSVINKEMDFQQRKEEKPKRVVLEEKPSFSGTPMFASTPKEGVEKVKVEPGKESARFGFSFGSSAPPSAINTPSKVSATPAAAPLNAFSLSSSAVPSATDTPSKIPATPAAIAASVGKSFSFASSGGPSAVSTPSKESNLFKPAAAGTGLGFGKLKVKEEGAEESVPSTPGEDWVDVQPSSTTSTDENKPDVKPAGLTFGAKPGAIFGVPKPEEERQEDSAGTGDKDKTQPAKPKPSAIPVPSAFSFNSQTTFSFGLNPPTKPTSESEPDEDVVAESSNGSEGETEYVASVNYIRVVRGPDEDSEEQTSPKIEEISGDGSILQSLTSPFESEWRGEWENVQKEEEEPVSPVEPSISGSQQEETEAEDAKSAAGTGEEEEEEAANVETEEEPTSREEISNVESQAGKPQPVEGAVEEQSGVDEESPEPSLTENAILEESPGVTAEPSAADTEEEGEVPESEVISELETPKAGVEDEGEKEPLTVSEEAVAEEESVREKPASPVEEPEAAPAVSPANEEPEAAKAASPVKEQTPETLSQEEQKEGAAVEEPKEEGEMDQQQAPESESENMDEAMQETDVGGSTESLTNAFGSGFGSFGGQTSTASGSNVFGSFGTPSTSAFGTQSAFGSPATTSAFGSFCQSTPATANSTPSAFGGPSTPATSSVTTPFGQKPTPIFGQSSSLGTPSAAASAFGQSPAPAFGQSSSFGSSPSGFGSGFGSMASAAGVAFGSGASLGANNSPFGQATPGFSASPLGSSVSPLASMANSIKQASGGGFGAYASKPTGFAAFANTGSPGFGSVAQQPQQSSGFGTSGSQQQQPAGFAAFGQQSQQQQPSGFAAFGQQAQQQQPSGFAAFGSQQQSSGFGAFGGGGQQSGGFGGTGMSGFGQAAQGGASVFGSSSSASSGFGTSSGSKPEFSKFGSFRGGNMGADDDD